MLRKSFLLFVLILLSRLTANAAIFLVTSNADSGPGTLRQALLDAAANGGAEKDFIHFNLPDQSEAGRTIKILTVLPDIPSNVDIDGTTQPGNNFGVSSAKIKILMTIVNPAGLNWCINIYNKSDIGIFGLVIDRDASLFNNGGGSVGINIIGSQRLKIGDKSKGNVIKNFRVNILSYIDLTDLLNAPVTTDVDIRSNFIGINEDGRTQCQLGSGQLGINSIKNFTLGGPNPEDGNVIFGYSYFDNMYNFRKVDLGELFVVNNLFGLDYLGQNTIGNLDDPTQVSSFSVSDHPGNLKECTVTKNTLTGGMGFQTGGYFTLSANKFGTDITGTKIFQHNSFGIDLGYCTGGAMIGGPDPGDGNIFAGSYQPDYLPADVSAIIHNTSSRGIEVLGNIFRCNNGLRPMSLNGVTNNVPVITSRTSTEISGTAVPDARVDLYYSMECKYCEPQVFFASVGANSAGDWKYTGTLANSAIIAAATITDGTTSEFTGLYFTNTDIDVKIGTACAGQNGYIKGITANGAKTYAWYNEAGVLAGSAPDLTNALPGKYHLIISDDYCSASSPIYEVKNIQTQISDANTVILNTSCGASNGSITGLQTPSGSTYVWKDDSGNTVGHSLDLTNVPSGKYTLTVTAMNASCAEIYGPVTVKNNTGPNIDQSSTIKNPTNCGQSIGSITGISATGTGILKYSWTNQLNQQVGTSKDLLNQPAGKYTLRVTDETQCGPVYTTALEILELNGITLDESALQINIASCSNANGSVTGIKALGATQYKWTDANNVTKSNAINLQNVPSGDYTFTASNAFGCVQTKTYHVGQQAATIYPVYASNIVNSCYGVNNGSIAVSTNALVKSARWTNSQDETTGSGNSIPDLAAGSYKLYLTDINGCESLYNTYNVTEIPELKIIDADVAHDECGLKTGSIKNVRVSGGVPPYTYSWFNADNSPAGTTPDIHHLGGGVYRLIVTDSRNCAQPSASYTVQDISIIITPPTADNVQTCAPGKITLTVNNPLTIYKYRLYDTENANVPVDEQASGRFSINVTGNTTFFISQLHGTCESPRAKVSVTVGISKPDIENVFTPNGDGVNDFWKITGIENARGATVQVFNRGGQLVFNSKGYAVPFNGTSNGKDLPIGNYYYIINMGSACSVLSGSITLIR